MFLDSLHTSSINETDRHMAILQHKSFWGGVDPPARKKQTQGKSARTAPLPRFLIFPLSNEKTCPAPLPVQIGDYLRMGERLPTAPGAMPMHASVSGYVRALGTRWHPFGKEVFSLVLENDTQYLRHTHMGTRREGGSLGAAALLQAMDEAGITGPGGVAFPAVQQGALDTLIINGCECEPYVTADDSLMCCYPEQVTRGAMLIASILQPAAIQIAIEDNKPEAIAAIRACIAAHTLPIAVRVLPAKYPQGAKEQLIQAVTGREIPPGGRPEDVGCAVYNVSTCASIYKAAYHREPILKRIVTITGGAVRRPENFIAPIGTPLAHLIEAAGGFAEAPYKIIAGGPMMGIAQAVLDAPILRNINAIICLGNEDRVQQEHPTCLRCGKCLSVCPMHLQPLYIHRYEAAGNLPQLRRLHISDCNECGCCAYICPGKVQLVEAARRAKQMLGIPRRAVWP